MDSNMKYIVCLTLQLLLLAGCGRNMGENREKINHDFFPKAKGLNVVVISFDALRADALGCYGSQLGATPNIDAFAKEAVVFNNAHSAAQSTPTSFAAAFTGKLPFRSFVGWKMIAGQTIASVFKDSGYSTSFINTNGNVIEKRDFNQGFDSFYTNEAIGDEEMLPKVIELIEAKKNEKFFAWFHFINPHGPYDYREMSKKFYDPTYDGRFKNSVPSKYTVESAEEIKYVKQLYNGEVFYADFVFGEVLGALKKNGLDKNTLIILTSDHGEEFLEHGGVEHNNLFEEVIRIPLLIKHPHASQAGVTDLPYVNIDLLPTLAGILQLEYNSKIDGVDLGEAKSEGRKRVAVAMTNKNKVELSLMIDSKKLIHMCTPEKKQSLFDLAKDPKELTDIFDAQRTLASTLDNELKVLVGSKDPCQVVERANQGVSPEKELTNEQIKRLKTLGYLQ